MYFINQLPPWIATTYFTAQHWLGQIPLEVEQPAGTPEQLSLVFSGPRFFVALISGILLAFGFQLLLTNLSVAAGISYLTRSSHSDTDSSYSDRSDHEGGLNVRRIQWQLGLWTLISVTIALFLACFFAVQLSLLTDVALAAIIGLVIWAAYFTLLVWFSSSTIGSLVGSVVNAATSGFQALVGAASAAVGSRVAKQQIVSTTEAVVAAVRNELGSAIDPVSMRNSVENYIQRLPIPQLNTDRLREDFQSLLNDPEIAALAESDRLQHIDRQAFVDLVRQRTDFSNAEVERVADLMNDVWSQTLKSRRKSNPLEDLAHYLRSTEPGKLQLSELNAKLDRLLSDRSQSQGAQGEQSSPGMVQQTVQMGMNTLIGMLAGRTDLSDLNLEKILAQLKQAPDKISSSTDQIKNQLKSSTPGTQGYSPIRNDVANYLLDTYFWQRNREVVEREFREVLFDPNADPGSVVDHLRQINRSYFVEVLSSRGMLTPTRIEEVANQLEAIRVHVLTDAISAQELEIANDLQHRIELFLSQAPKEELYAEDVSAFRALLNDDTVSHEALQACLAAYDRASLQVVLSQRSDVSPDEMNPLLNRLEAARDRVLFESRSTTAQAQQKLEEYQRRLGEYLLRASRPELTSEGIQQNVQALLREPQLGLDTRLYRSTRFDRATTAQILRQRGDLSESDINHVLDQIEATWSDFVYSPRPLTQAAMDNYNQTLSSISEYLRRTNLEELNPEGIQRDLSTLLDNPKEGSLALRRRLSQIDRETLVRLMSQRQDLNEAQVNQTIDQLQEGIRRIARAPRRLALRTQNKLSDFESTFEDYLRNTNKEELNPEGIKRDLNLLLHSPRHGLQNLSDRLAHIDRTTIIALLSQRQDISKDEAERIIAQIESARNQVMEEMKRMQYRIQSVIQQFFERIRSYLNSLDRPELSYEGIQHDVSMLFDDPKAGFDALRDRLGQFDRNTLVSIISSRRDISEADANRIIDQIESARMSVLRRAENIQVEAQRRIEEVKLQAQRQMEETQKAAATAAWWLFVTALTSAIAAAGAGMLAAR